MKKRTILYYQFHPQFQAIEDAMKELHNERTSLDAELNTGQLTKEEYDKKLLQIDHRYQVLHAKETQIRDELFQKLSRYPKPERFSILLYMKKPFSQVYKMKKDMLYGAIAGDIAGSTYEFFGMTGAETELFPAHSTFTDDTILTLAVADAITNQVPFAQALLTYATLYPQPKGGYGTRFVSWLMQAHFTGQIPPAYISCGNGSAMRVSPCAWAADRLEEVLALARQSAECTHNHPEGIKGAEATAAAIFLAREGNSKERIRGYIHAHYYDMSPTLQQLYDAPYRFGASCQDTVPKAILSFIHSDDFESAIRLSMLTNKDTDTAAAITGAIAGAYYGVPEHIKQKVRSLLDPKLLSVLDDFEKKYGW